MKLIFLAYPAVHQLLVSLTSSVRFRQQHFFCPLPHAGSAYVCLFVPLTVRRTDFPPISFGLYVAVGAGTTTHAFIPKP